MSEYVQGFVLPVPTKNLKAYKKMADSACKAWIKYGALDYRECYMTDDHKKDCKVPFSKLAKTKKGETVVFAWITYKSKQDAAKIMKKIMKDTSIECDENNMPFDMKRMTFGGFDPFVSSNDLGKPVKKTKAKAKPKAKRAVKTRKKSR